VTAPDPSEPVLRPPVPALELFARATVAVSPPYDVGRVLLGERRVVPIEGGRIEGDRLNGEILPGGADWQIVCADGTALLEARYLIRTHDGAIITVRNAGVRHGPAEVLEALGRGEAADPSTYYFRATPSFEASDERYAWLNRIVAVASGARDERAVRLAFYRVT
jgi:hypothetical protein